MWESIVRDIKKIIEKNRSTLVFVNSRRLCEKITFLINKDELHPVAYTHHGSLSRELRSDVERKLKAGDLKAIVATNSLELGIDIGTLDEVVLIQTPPSISAGIQRIGRAGHDVGRTSNGLLFPTHSHDFLESAVMAAGIIHLLTRRFLPLRQITVETINEENASRSPFVDFLRISFDVLLDYKHVVLYRKA